MQSKHLPGYPSLYKRKTLPPFLVGVLLLGISAYCIYQRVSGVLTALCITGFVATIIYMIVRVDRELLPRTRACPGCGSEMHRLDEGRGTPIHYDCDACQTHWKTGLHVPQD